MLGVPAEEAMSGRGAAQLTPLAVPGCLATLLSRAVRLARAASVAPLVRQTARADLTLPMQCFFYGHSRAKM